MKTLKSILVLMIALFSTEMAIARETVIEPSKLPQASQVFLKKHFPNQKIASATEERDDVFWKEYKVFLTGGASIEFDSKGVWKEVKVRSGVPATIVPVAIQKHVQSNYPNETIMELKKEKRGIYDVELSNGMELKFNSAFKLMKMEY